MSHQLEQPVQRIEVAYPSKRKARVFGAAVIALVAGVAYLNLHSCDAKTEITINAQSVADELNLPASLDVVEIQGGSSSTSNINIKQSLFWQDFSIGNITFPTSRYGTVDIEYDVLKNEQDNSSELDTDNFDKTIKLSVEEKDGVNHLVIEADPAYLSANTENMKSGEGSVDTSGLISFFRSLTPDLAEQIATGSAAWNDENFRLSCAKKVTKLGLVKAGIAKAVAAQFQINSAVITDEIIKMYPEYLDHPEIKEQIEKHLAVLTDPATMEVRFKTDPNNPKAENEGTSEAKTEYMQASNVNGLIMAQFVGLNESERGDITLNESSADCTLDPLAEQDLLEIRNMWRAATPYDDSLIERLEAKGN